MKKVSVLLPTRKRFDSFTQSINSLFENCSDIENFEVMVALDNDDIETIEKIKGYALDKPNIRLYFYERQYYHGLNNYYNDLANNASGTSLLLWNDDAVIRSKDWDLEVLKHHETFCVLSPKVDTMEKYWRTQGVLFPILPKRWIEITGEWSRVPACDSWIDVLSKRLNLLVNVESIVISHNRHDITGDNHDETYIEGRESIRDPQHFSLYNIGFPDVLEEHYQKLYANLNS
jgi:glycosyltransferase involved in cell wall biosynthesis